MNFLQSRHITCCRNFKFLLFTLCLLFLSRFPVETCQNFLTMVQELDIKPARLIMFRILNQHFLAAILTYISLYIYIYIHTLFTHVWIHICFDYNIYNATSIQWYITYGSYPSINSLQKSQPSTNSLNKNSEQPNSVNKQPQNHSPHNNHSHQPQPKTALGGSSHGS